MSADFLIITNNPMVKNINDIDIKWVDDDSTAVYYQTYNMVAAGHKLLSHPLAGSVKPNQNPFRSIMVSKSAAGVDNNSLKIIEKCLTKVEFMSKDKSSSEVQRKFADDLQEMDLELMLSALESIK